MAALFGGKTFDPDKDIPDLSGKVFIVTGGSQGIGLGISSHIVQHKPKKLIFLSNKREHADQAKDFFEKYGDTSVVEWIQVDFADLKQTQEVAQRLKENEPQIDGLVLNAGIGVGVFKITPDGYDSHFQINVLTQFLLANTLLPNIKNTAAKSKDARIVFQSSDLHKLAVDEVKFASVEELNQDIGATKLYDRSKLAVLCLAQKLGNDLRTQGEKNIYVNATHPGFVGTDQQSQMYEPYGVAAKIGNFVMRPFAKDPITKGCRPALFAATSPEILEQGINASYISVDKDVAEPSEKSQDKELQNRLWELSNSMLKSSIGVSF